MQASRGILVELATLLFAGLDGMGPLELTANQTRTLAVALQVSPRGMSASTPEPGKLRPWPRLVPDMGPIPEGVLHAHYH